VFASSREGQRERERQRILNRLCGMEPLMGLHLMTLRS